MDTQESRGEKWERLGFAYCKIATVSLLAGRFALPIAATLSSAFFTLAYFNGQRITRCVGRYPLYVATFWAVIVTVWISAELNPSMVPSWLIWLHR